MHRFTPLHELGRGHFGVVYAAQRIPERELADNNESKIVAVKRLNKRPMSFDDACSEMEVQALVAVRGAPNVVELLELAYDSGRTYLVMKLAKGKSLLEAIPGQEGMSMDAVRGIMKGVLYAVEALHRAGFMHRDIKPENILVDPVDLQNPQNVVLCDLGSCAPLVASNNNDAHESSSFGASSSSSSKPFTPMWGYVTTRFYRAPEMIRRDPHYNDRVDSWALGCVAFECALGRPLFPAKDEVDLLLRVCAVLGSPPRPEEWPCVVVPRNWPQRSTYSAFAGAGANMVKIPKGFIQFVDSFVAWDAKDRMSPSQALSRCEFLLGP